ASFIFSDQIFVKLLERIASEVLLDLLGRAPLIQIRRESMDRDPGTILVMYPEEPLCPDASRQHHRSMKGLATVFGDYGTGTGHNKGVIFMLMYPTHPDRVCWHRQLTTIKPLSEAMHRHDLDTREREHKFLGCLDVRSENLGRERTVSGTIAEELLH